MPLIQPWTVLPASAGFETIHTMIRIATIMPIVFCSNVSSPPDPRLSARGHGRIPTDSGNRCQSDRRWSGSNITYLDGKDQQAATAICECRIALQFAAVGATPMATSWSGGHVTRPAADAVTPGRRRRSSRGRTCSRQPELGRARASCRGPGPRRTPTRAGTAQPSGTWRRVRRGPA
jgi:hypothetical protein